MKITCVICEYNPFHNGHEYMLRQLRENGSTHIAAIMSGNFTQRGEAAIYDKFTRTRAALTGGADLVIELPVSFACANAQRFAYGGVYLAESLGCTEELAFGSESGNTELLTKAASAIDDERVRKDIGERMSSGITFAAAREQAVEKIFGKNVSQLLHSPNDILGIEYIRALNIAGSRISPVSVKRIGAAHDSSNTENNITSAKNIREMLYSGNNDGYSYIPDAAAGLFRSAENKPPYGGRKNELEKAMIYRLRTMTKEQLAALPEISEGLENRLYDSIRKSVSVEEIADSTKSKRYTRARINRILTYALLGFEKSSLSESPQYVRILGMNSRGKEILRAAKKTAKLPVVMKYSDLEYGTKAHKMFMQESMCDDIYALSGKDNDICGRNFTGKMIIQDLIKDTLE